VKRWTAQILGDVTRYEISVVAEGSPGHENWGAFGADKLLIGTNSLVGGTTDHLLHKAVYDALGSFAKGLVDECNSEEFRRMVTDIANDTG